MGLREAPSEGKGEAIWGEPYVARFHPERRPAHSNLPVVLACTIPALRSGISQDFLHDFEANFGIAAWAHRMGPEVTIGHPDREQPSCECGYIAACVMAKLKNAGNDWLTEDVDDANDEQWVR